MIESLGCFGTTFARNPQKEGTPDRGSELLILGKALSLDIVSSARNVRLSAFRELAVRPSF